MKKKRIFIVMLLVLPVFAFGCGRSAGEGTSTQIFESQVEDTSTRISAGGYQTITAEEAFAMLQDPQEDILLDVRTQEEFDAGHIAGALLLPDYEVAQKAEGVLPDKDARILVYCRSGRRSAAAAAELAELGYTNVYDFGGIIDWPYETVTAESAKG